MSLVSRLTSTYERLLTLQDKLGEPAIRTVIVDSPGFELATCRLRVTRVSKGDLMAFRSSSVEISEDTCVIEFPRTFTESSLAASEFKIDGIPASYVYTDTRDPILLRVYVNPRRYR